MLPSIWISTTRQSSRKELLLTNYYGVICKTLSGEYSSDERCKLNMEIQRKSMFHNQEIMYLIFLGTCSVFLLILPCGVRREQCIQKYTYHINCNFSTLQKRIMKHWKYLFLEKNTYTHIYICLLYHVP